MGEILDRRILKMAVRILRVGLRLNLNPDPYRAKGAAPSGAGIKPALHGIELWWAAALHGEGDR